MTPEMVESINVFGVTLILLAFVLLSLKKLDASNRWYHLLNFVGAGFACFGAYKLGSWAFVVLEGVWSAVALFALLKGSFYTRTEKHNA